jgi:hypothetical protein
MEDLTFLERLKAGDTVGLVPSGYSSREIAEPRTVVRVTEKFVVLLWADKSDRRFRRKDGYEAGKDSEWHRAYLVEWTPKRATTLRRSQVVSRLARLNWAGYDAETLFAVESLIEKALEKAKKEKEKTHG